MEHLEESTVDDASRKGLAPARLRLRLKRPDTIVAPGVFNGLTARLAAKHGFKALYFSGGGFANSLGLADLGVTTLTEVADAVSSITYVCKLPLIVDMDTGFGEAVNVARAVQLLERAGAAAVHIEDQVMPKKCGHLPKKELVTTEEMVKKLLAAKKSSKAGLVLIARTDARAVEGMDAAIERSRIYVDAGADVIFPEALESEEEFREFARKVRGPLLANMTEFGKTPYLSASQFAQLGYKVVLFPMTALRAMLKTADRTYAELAKKGSQKEMVNSLMTRVEVYELIDYGREESLDSELSREAQRIMGTKSPK